MTMSLSSARPIQAVPVAGGLRSDSVPRALTLVVGNRTTSPLTPIWVGGFSSDGCADRVPSWATARVAAAGGTNGTAVVRRGSPGRYARGGAWARGGGCRGGAGRGRDTGLREVPGKVPGGPGR